MSWGRKPICGVGINDVYDDPVLAKHPLPKYYETWRSMIKRCYWTKYHQRRPTYINCSVSKEWIYLSNFREWFNENYIEGYHLDKDLLFPGNKVYGSDTCVFVPGNINQFFTFSNSIRGKYPLGVSLRKNENLFVSTCNIGNGKKISKYFKDLAEAHFWYLEQKINVINQYLQEDYSDKIKTGLTHWKKLFTHHLDNRIIFNPDDINFDEKWL